jgi:hypothetical protein
MKNSCTQLIYSSEKLYDEIKELFINTMKKNLFPYED